MFPEADGSEGLRSFTFSQALKIDRDAARLGTGSEALDKVLEGGYEEGKITEVFGVSNSGKTQAAIQATVMAAARGWKSVFVDTEATFRPERVEQIAAPRGVDVKAALEAIYTVRARDVREQIGVLRRIAEDPRVRSAKLVVIDTVTKNFTLEFPGRERVGRRQGALGAYLNRIALDAFLHRRIVLITNRVASVSRGEGSQDVDVGGLTLRKFVSRSVRLRRQGAYVYASLELPTPGEAVRTQLTERGIE